MNLKEIDIFCDVEHVFSYSTVGPLSDYTLEQKIEMINL